MDDRKERILKAVIEEYIDTAEPVGSKCLHSKYDIEFSTATIRNEMAEMEEMGFLVQPHTSAGRIPSDKAYRYYVDEVVSGRLKIDPEKLLSSDDIEKIREALHIKVDEFGDGLRRVADVISEVTDYTAFAIKPSMKTSTVSAVQVVPAQPGMCLVMVVTKAGPTSSTVVKVPEQAGKEYLINFSEFINHRLAGLTVEEITYELCEELVKMYDVDVEVLMPVVNGVSKCIRQIDNPQIVYDGANKIFKHPEFNDIDMARQFLELIDNDYLLQEAAEALTTTITTSTTTETTPTTAADVDIYEMNSSAEDNSFFEDEDTNRNALTIHIGDENRLKELKGLSMLTSHYRIGDDLFGDIGIIGPKRMDYVRVIACIRYVKKFIDAEFGNIDKNYKGEDAEDE